MEYEEKVPLTIYFPKKIYDEIVFRSDTFRRSKNQEVLYLIDIGLASEKKRTNEILSLLKEQSPK